MKQLITAKLKLYTTLEQFQALRQAQLAYRGALNYVSRYAFENGKMSNQRALQKATYDTIRATYGLPAQMACNVPRQVWYELEKGHGSGCHFPLEKAKQEPRGYAKHSAQRAERS